MATGRRRHREEVGGNRFTGDLSVFGWITFLQ
jgi:hypothetical protein